MNLEYLSRVQLKPRALARILNDGWWLSEPSGTPTAGAAKKGLGLVTRILVVDDEPHIREIIRFALEKGNMRVTEARNGAEALEQVKIDLPDLIVLDIGMPELDGLEVCRRLRKTSDIPILFLSARDEEIDRILGLEIGGDDYVTKPFSPRELAARVSVILKRAKSLRPTAEHQPRKLQHGSLELDADGFTTAFDGAAITLTSLEFQMVKCFLTRPGFVFTRDQLMSSAYDGNIHVSDRTIDSHIRNIRAKFAKAGCSSAIETVHGVGFRLGTCEAGR